MHQIGVGVLGPVFRTYEPSEDRLVAVKAFHLDLTPEQAQRFVDVLGEIVRAQLEHPAIVSPIAADLEDGIPYLAQQYVATESLDVAMRHYAPASLETALPLITQLGKAIDAAHERGHMHGALHLRDIFVTSNEARTTGFGVVKALEEVGLRGPIRRPYAAPEVIIGRPWGQKADYFALAAIAYELLTGKRAAGTDEQVIGRLDIVAEVDDRKALHAVFTTGLGDSPEARYASATDFVVGLHAAIGRDFEGGSVTALASAGETKVPGATDLRVLDRTPEKIDRFDPAVVNTMLLGGGIEDEVKPVVGNGSAEAAHPPEELRLPLEDGQARVAEELIVSERSMSPVVDEPDYVRPNETSSWSLRAVVQMVVAIAVAALAAYVIALGLGFRDVSLMPQSTSPSRDQVLESPVKGSDETTSEWSEAAGDAEISARVADVPVPLEVLSDAQDDPVVLTPQVVPPPSISPARELELRVESEARPGVEELATAVTLSHLVEVRPDHEPAVSAGSGWLLVRTNPPGAHVMINEQDWGKTPLSLQDVAFGLHHVEIHYDGYESVSRDVTLTADGAVAAVSVNLGLTSTLSPASGARIASGNVAGSMFVKSRPSRARVLLDDQLVGMTPILLPDVTVGGHRVRIERDGYQSWVTTVDVPPLDRVRVAASLDRLRRR